MELTGNGHLEILIESYLPGFISQIFLTFWIGASNPLSIQCLKMREAC